MSHSTLLFAGDPHGNFKPLIRAAQESRPAALITLGDHDLEQPLPDVVQPLIEVGIRVYWIAGNHDGDREHWYANLFRGISGLWNLHGRVVEIAGVQVAGLGGVFREQVYFPDGREPRFWARDEMPRTVRLNDRWAAPGEGLPGLPRRHRVTIFPEDIDRLAGLKADILLCHEALSSHRYGFEEIDLLAEVMGARLIVHGHHHESYLAVLPSGISVRGVAAADVLPWPAFAS